VVRPPSAGEVAIVTGGTSGAGPGLARELARRGYAVVVVYLSDQAQAEAVVDGIVAGEGTALAVRADVADELDVERLFEETTAAFGRVDLVVMGSGIASLALARELTARGIAAVQGPARRGIQDRSEA
jgi:NAD(P)-dependent dehydrogenase (short-subunit alcohol dehydrogenase family)